MQGAWAILLSRYSGEADVVFGVVRSTRRGTIEGADDVIGLCINTLPMRVHVSSEMTLVSWLKDIRAQWISIRDHEHTPLVKVQGWSEVPAGHPLFASVVMFQNYHLDTKLRMQGGAWSNRRVRLIQQTNYPVSLSVYDSAELHLTILFDRNRIDDDAAARMLGHVRTLLEEMATKPERKVGELSILTSSERHQLLVEWNQTEVNCPRDKCVHQLFEDQVERTPDAIAVMFEDQCLTYRELNNRSNQIAHHLRTLGVGPEVLVGLCVERSLSMIVALLGILKAGGAYVPLDPAYPKDRICFVLDDAQVRVLLTHSSFHADLGSEVSSYKVVCLDTDLDWISKAPAENPKSDVEPGNLAYVIYTSGSTGKPKGVAIEHHSPVELIHWAHRIFSPQECAGVLFSTSICFDLSVFEMFVPLSCGGKIILAQNALQLVTLPAAREVTLVNMVPSAIKELVRRQALPPSVCTVNLAGEPLEVDLVKQIYQIPSVKKVYDLYGPSETTTYSTWALRRADGPYTIGRPIANTQIYLLDRNQNPVPIGVPGQIYIGGEGLARGYWNRPALTRDKFVADPFKPKSGDRLYKTGDLARYLPDGNIEFLGRIDHQVKVRGYRIELGEIESVLKLHPAVRETVVVVREDVPGDKRLVAYVRSGASGDNFIRELRTELEQQLPAYMVPSDVVVLEAFPLTPNGKLDRKALPAPEGRSPELEGSYVAPRTPTEEVLASIWCEVLNLKRVGIHDNFFELGGHSLLAIQVVARLAKLLKLDLPLHRFFETATISTLAAELQKMLGAGETGDVRSIVPVPRTGNLPLSFAQQRLWFLDRLLPNKAAYNIPTVWQLRGQLDALALERSLNELVVRHETLRTRFVLSGDAPVQVIEPPSAVALPITDLSSMPQVEREARVRQITDTEARQPFDLEAGPLLRAQLLRLAAEEHLLLFNLHHIASDDWSMGVLCRELSSGYNAFVSGHAPDLPRLPIQYADYAVWQREWLRGEMLEGQLAYWKEKLADLSALELPTDRPRPPVPSYQGAHLTFDLPAPLTQALKELSRREGATLFMTLLAAFQVLLHRYSGQEDIAVGTPIAGRAAHRTRGADWLLRQHAGTALQPRGQSRIHRVARTGARDRAGRLHASGSTLREARRGTLPQPRHQPQSAVPGDVRAAERAGRRAHAKGRAGESPAPRRAQRKVRSDRYYGRDGRRPTRQMGVQHRPVRRLYRRAHGATL